MSFPQWLGDTKRTEKEGLCFFVRPEYGGGKIALRNLADASAYKSAEFCDIAVEELTENRRDVFEDLVLFRLRTPGIDRPCFLGGTNPTGIGLQWVKSLWVDKKYPPELQHLKHEFSYVPALLSDNPHLGVDYRESLKGLPEKKRKALLEGDWTIPEGQYFINFEPSERRIHSSIVSEIVQPWWNHWISQDWGFKHHTPVHWHAVGNVMPEQANLLGRDWDSPRRCVFTYREHVESLGDSGRSEEQLAQTILAKSGTEKIKAWILSSDAFGEKSSNNTAAEMLTLKGLPPPQPSNMGPGSRVVGWRFMYQLIQDDAWFISDLCPEALAAIPSLEYDSDKGGEDILKTDHMYDDIGDELRYGLQDMLNAKNKAPMEVRRAEIAATKTNPTELAMAMRRFESFEKQHKRRRTQMVWPIIGRIRVLERENLSLLKASQVALTKLNEAQEDAKKALEIALDLQVLVRDLENRLTETEKGSKMTPAVRTKTVPFRQFKAMAESLPDEESA